MKSLHDFDTDKKKRVTQDDVARRAGVSRSMVSYVLNNGSRSVAPETKERILLAIQELDYRPNKFAQKLLKTQYDAVAEKQLGIVLSDVFMLRRPYYADILAGIHRTAHQNDHHIRFIRFFDDLKNPILFNELIHEEEISGLILIALDQSIHNEKDREIITHIRKRINNIICIEWECEGIPSINFNRQEAVYKACLHLIDQGYRKIAYIGQMDSRILGYQQALLERNLSYSDRHILESANMKDGSMACQEIIDSADVPDAIMAGCDEVAIGVLHSMNLNGISVPDRVGIASIDNIEMAEYTHPPLTTVNVQTAEMGQYAVQLLMNHTANPDTPAASVLLPTKLIIRDSCRLADRT